MLNTSFLRQTIPSLRRLALYLSSGTAAAFTVLNLHHDRLDAPPIQQAAPTQWMESSLASSFATFCSSKVICQALAQVDDDDDDEKENDDDPPASIPIGYTLIPVPDRAHFRTHAIFGQLRHQPGGITDYRVYANQPAVSKAAGNIQALHGETIVVATITIGDELDGHPGLVHGGILCLLMDDVLGFGFYALGVPAAVTANLNVDFRQSVPAGTTLHMSCQLVQMERRKLLWKVRVTSPDERILYCEASSVYVIPRQVYRTM